MDPDQEWADWQAWLGDRIYSQVVEMMAFRQVWDVFFDVFKNAPNVVQEDPGFLVWFRLAFARSQGMGVRRMADTRADVVSLARLIARVRQRPSILSRERYLASQSIASDDLRRWASASFHRLAGPGDHIAKRTAAQDFDDLQTKTAAVRKWVNDSIAHLKKGRPVEEPPLQDVHDAVDVVVDLFAKYDALIRGSTLVPGVIMDPWPFVFTVPWIAEGQWERVLAKMYETERRLLEHPQGGASGEGRRT
jgi:hypothetical protein